jgi:hypothetical protein
MKERSSALSRSPDRWLRAAGRADDSAAGAGAGAGPAAAADGQDARTYAGSGMEEDWRLASPITAATDMGRDLQRV